MKVLRKGEAHMHDRITVSCDFCDSTLQYWRDEPGTVTDYIDEDCWRIELKCPVCGMELCKAVNKYKNIPGEGFLGLEKDVVLSKEEKAEIEELMNSEED